MNNPYFTEYRYIAIIPYSITCPEVIARNEREARAALGRRFGAPLEAGTQLLQRERV